MAEAQPTTVMRLSPRASMIGGRAQHVDGFQPPARVPPCTGRTARPRGPCHGHSACRGAPSPRGTACCAARCTRRPPRRQVAGVPAANRLKPQAIGEPDASGPGGDIPRCVTHTGSDSANTRGCSRRSGAPDKLRRPFPPGSALSPRGYSRSCWAEARGAGSSAAHCIYAAAW